MKARYGKLVSTALLCYIAVYVTIRIPLGALVPESDFASLDDLVKWVGAGYLLWVGVRLLRAPAGVVELADGGALERRAMVAGGGEHALDLMVFALIEHDFHFVLAELAASERGERRGFVDELHAFFLQFCQGFVDVFHPEGHMLKAAFTAISFDEFGNGAIGLRGNE